jgi:hypothetical protein
MNAGLINSFPHPSTRPSLQAARIYPGFADMLSGSQCQVDFIDMPCGMAGGEATALCPNGCRTLNLKTNRVEYFHAYSDERSGYLPPDATYLGDGYAYSPSAAGSAPVEDELAGYIELDHAPQNTSSRRLTKDEVTAVRDKISKWLDKPKCNDFVKNLIATAAGIASSQNQYNTLFASDPDVLVLFDIIENKGGGFNYDKSLPFNTVKGSIAAGNPSVWLLPPESHSASLTSEELANIIDEAAFHETIHQMTRGWLTDQVLAQAILKMPIKLDVLPKGDITSNSFEAITNASYFWDHYLFQNCVKEGK